MKEIKTNNVPIKMWTEGVAVELEALNQLHQLAEMPFMYKHVAVMPDVHAGKGSTVGSVIATKGAIIPAAVGVDIGCGMIAKRISLKAAQLPDSLKDVRLEIEELVPVGFNEHEYSTEHSKKFDKLLPGLTDITNKHPEILNKGKDLFSKASNQLGTLGGGNHFIELCIDENDDVWIMLHSGSRGIGNIIGSYFIERAKEEMIKAGIKLSNKDLSYLTENTQNYIDYVDSVEWAQTYAFKNREVMMDLVIAALQKYLPPFVITEEAINCHHNFVEKEEHFGEKIHITRKGAVMAKKDQLGIIPGSMGTKSYIVRGKGNPESFHSCSHGAGRKMSRTEAKRRFTLEDHRIATQGVECRKDISVLDETPGCYKDIDKVMLAQQDLVETVHVLKQVLCVKG